MFNKWTNNTPPTNTGNNTGEGSTAPLGEQFVVLLLYGKNTFGDKIYSYLKIMLPDLQKLKAAIKSGGNFNPSDFGTILFAGRDEPTDEVKAEMAAICPVINTDAMPPNYVHQYNPNALAALPKKSWDEF